MKVPAEILNISDSKEDLLKAMKGGDSSQLKQEKDAEKEQPMPKTWMKQMRSQTMRNR